MKTNKFNLLILLSLFIILFSACNKDDDSSKDPNACIDANQELMSCYNCCSKNGFDVGELDLITLECECYDEEEEEEEENNNNSVICSSASDFEDCQQCCISNSYNGASFTSFSGCECFN